MARRTDTAESETQDRKAPEKGIVEPRLEVVSEFPTFSRKSGYTRESEITQTLENVKNEYPEGTVVLIREYEKRESANGTLYNLRKRNGKPGTEGWTGFTIQVGPIADSEHTGLYVSYTNPANA